MLIIKGKVIWAARRIFYTTSLLRFVFNSRSLARALPNFERGPRISNSTTNLSLRANTTKNSLYEGEPNVITAKLPLMNLCSGCTMRFSLGENTGPDWRCCKKDSLKVPVRGKKSKNFPSQTVKRDLPRVHTRWHRELRRERDRP